MFSTKLLQTAHKMVVSNSLFSFMFETCNDRRSIFPDTWRIIDALNVNRQRDTLRDID